MMTPLPQIHPFCAAKKGPPTSDLSNRAVRMTHGKQEGLTSFFDLNVPEF
jgi:hypothetical protein